MCGMRLAAGQLSFFVPQVPRQLNEQGPLNLLFPPRNARPLSGQRPVH